MIIVMITNMMMIMIEINNECLYSALNTMLLNIIIIVTTTDS